MDVSIVIRTKNEENFIDATLRRIAEQDLTASYEIIVVDSGSTDTTLDIVKRYHTKLVCIPQEKFTYGRSLNVGASHADGVYIVNLSAHACPSDGKWLRNLIASFEDSGVAAVYGRQMSRGQLNPFEARRNESFFGRGKIVFSMQNRGMWKRVHFSNSNSAIRKEVWKRFRFNEEVPYAEDIWWQREVMAAGFSIAYAPDASVYHTHKVSLHNAYKNAKACTYSLAAMDHKAQSIFMLMVDLGAFWGLVPNSILQNLRYIWRNRYREYLIIAPFYVTCECLGWLMGRTAYRLNR